MIVYFSNVSNFTHRFVEKLEVPALRIPINSGEAGTFTISADSILVCPTYAAGEQSFGVPKQVVKFLAMPYNRDRIIGVIATGNRNFGDKFCIAGDQLSSKLQVPVLQRVELAGTDQDIDIAREGIDKEWQKLVALRDARNQNLLEGGADSITLGGATMAIPRSTLMSGGRLTN